jgi:hypothetical protein
MYFLKEMGVPIPHWVAIAVGIISAIMLLIAAILFCQWFYLEQIKSKDSLLRRCCHLARSKLEPIHIIILALAVALCAAVWQAYRGPAEIATIGAERDKALSSLADVTTERNSLKQQIDALRQQPAPATPQITSLPTIGGAAVMALIRALQQSYQDNVLEGGDKATRYLVITAPPSQMQLKALLEEAIEIALKPNVLILPPPDSERILDAPKIPTPDINGLVTHGPDPLSGVLDLVLQRCFVMKRERADVPPELGKFYYPEKNPKIVWLAIGSGGSPWRNPEGCR